MYANQRKNLGIYVGILGDLQGPKIRVSTFKNGPIKLAIGDKFELRCHLRKRRRLPRKSWY